MLHDVGWLLPDEKPLAAVLLTTCDGFETRPVLFVDECRLRTLQLLITLTLGLDLSHV